MFPLWERVIAPVVDAVAPERVVEIGALRGETTALMLDRLGPDCELHVIDPVPQFDPTEHERRFAGQYVFHSGTSHEVLPHLDPFDVALVDGDHNWFTVFHELRMLADTARRAAVPLPVLVLHDVGWPYGRRDLYYEPSRIPEEHRHKYRRRGMRPGKSSLTLGGMNVGLANADHEGGPRNGVLTGLEDFLADHDVPVRLVVLPAYYGLAIAVEESRLAGNPELVAVLDHWESGEGARELVELLERIRVDEAILGQTWFRHFEAKVDRAASRYLTLVRSALSADGTAPFDPLESALARVHEDAVPGDLAQVGVGRGGEAVIQRAFVQAHEIADRTLWVAYEFSPGDEAALAQVRDGFERLDLLDDSVRFLPARALADAPFDTLALVHFGPGIGPGLSSAMESVHHRLSPGAAVIVGGVSDPLVERTVHEARARLDVTAPLVHLDADTVAWTVDQPHRHRPRWSDTR